MPLKYLEKYCSVRNQSHVNQCKVRVYWLINTYMMYKMVIAGDIRRQIYVCLGCPPYGRHNKLTKAINLEHTHTIARLADINSFVTRKMLLLVHK